ncbi:MAG: T9SS type A sorting domain-containing protein [Flavobacteriales bacterium]|nr:T9SS type A sorting domain-containing protein [Flavobacteriales bacterium]
MRKLFLSIIAVAAMAMSGFAQCNELFFSEYIEGSSNNKAIEIYNPTGSAIDLSDYAILRLNGGVSTTDTFYLSGSLASYDVYIVANASANAAILALKDTTGSATNFNGDDALTLFKISTQTALDIFGTPGIDPGTNWTVGSGASSEYTLVRKSTIKGGSLDWTTGVNEWDVYPQNTTTYLGSHTSDCYVPPTPEVGFKATSATFKENAGMVSVNVGIASPSSTVATTVEVVITGGSATNGAEYSATSPTTLTFAAGSSSNETFDITLNDNTMASGNSTIMLTLRNVSSGALLTADSTMTITIEDDDYLVAKIKDVKVNAADFNIANKGQKVEVTGIVYGIDFDGNAGISFTIIDSTAGVNIFNFNDVSDYVVTEGDEITVRGKMDFYNGLTEVFADSIKVNSSGNTLKDAVMVSKPSEETESDFIVIDRVWVADTNTVWPDNGNVWMTNGTDTFQVRIDRDASDIVGQPIEWDTLKITGIGGQFDNSSPYNSGYQIFPRKLSDIEKYRNAGIKEFTLSAKVFPNPTEGVVYIESVENLTSIRVFDIQGNVVSKTSANGLNAIVSLENLASGMYLIEINAEKSSALKRVVLK